MATTAKSIIKIREVVGKIKFDARNGKLPQKVLKRFIHCVDCVVDERVEGMITYPLKYLLLLTFLGVLSGAENFVDIANFSESYKPKLNGIIPEFKEHGVPSHDTFRTVLGLICPDQLQKAASNFLLDEIKQLQKTLGIETKEKELLNIDGKEQRGTGRKHNTDQEVGNLQTLHIYNASIGICLHSKPINEKTNEIPTAQELLKEMQLKDCIVTFDAMNTQKETIRIISEQKGDYVGALKKNHPLFYKEIELLFSDNALESIRKKGKNYRTYTEKSHNCIEKRTYYLSTNIKWFNDLPLWKKLKSFICYDLETEDIITGKKTNERRYYISSLTDIELVSDSIRGHWSVEQLHWHLDVAFSEDDNRTMDKNAFNNLSIINKMVLSLLKLVQPMYKVGIKTIRKRFGWNLIEHLTDLLSLLDEEMVAEALQNPISKTQK